VAPVGVGLKAQYLAPLLDTRRPSVLGADAFFEVHAENCMAEGGAALRQLERVRGRWPLSVHGVGASIGGPGPLCEAHLARLACVLERFEPRWFSEHLAWSSHGGHWFNDLLPLPYDTPTLQRVCQHVEQLQERLGRRVLLENPSRYLGFEHASWDEAGFLAEVVRRTGCGLLLDVNNAFVSAHNLGLDASAFIDALPAAAVGEIHLAGHSLDAGGSGLRIDDHGSPVDAAVWALYRHAIARCGPVPTLIERDHDVPPLEQLEAEAAQARRLMAAAACAAPGPALAPCPA
jgi:hypothetical protein